MNYWEWIFRQSKANYGVYDGDQLPIQTWDWPRQTWFQERLQYLRSARNKDHDGSSEDASSGAFS